MYAVCFGCSGRKTSALGRLPSSRSAAHASGELLWAVELSSAVYSPITACHPVGGQLHILLGTEEGRLHCLDASRGEERSRKQLGSPANSHALNTAGISSGAAPAVSSGRAWTTLDAHGEGRMGDAPCDHILCEEPGHLVGWEGDSRCLHLTLPEPSPGKPPSQCASQVWSCTNDGDLVLTKHGAAKPVVVAEARIGSPVFSSPVAFDNVVLFGCRDDHLYCVSME